MPVLQLTQKRVCKFMLGCWKEGGVGLQIDKNVIHIYMYVCCHCGEFRIGVQNGVVLQFMTNFFIAVCVSHFSSSLA